MTEPDPRLRARRAAFCILLVSCLSIFGALAAAGLRAQALFAQLQMQVLPAPTGLVLGVSSLAAHPAGLVVAALAALLACRLVLQGRADGRLKKLAITMGVGTVLYALLFVLAVYLPIVKIGQALQ